ncbi:hypothetical protein KUCAC02_028468 [Chaenocephalus aceratus]|uniref:Uncharacterized protein n=1 Tax=Chaenocephalus aceratus TaxID=36190 RepID=A0ACB9X3P9_CHAAC|nr:hypothetical protein KUCAC02_028468 [Chaenocephalus aceratus]
MLHGSLKSAELTFLSPPQLHPNSAARVGLPIPLRSAGFPADIVYPCRLQPVAIKLANKLVGWSPGSHSAPGCQSLIRFSSGDHWNYSPDMLWIILLILSGLTPLLLPRSSGSWSLLPGSPALASSVLAPLHWIMAPLYSLSDLHSFNNRLPPDCMDILADNEILCKRRRPSHRGSGHTFLFHSTSPHYPVHSVLSHAHTTPSQQTTRESD